MIDEAMGVAMFCPSCRKGLDQPASLCPDCGSKTQAQGYCEICRSHWLAPVGAVCPKHDLVLIDSNLLKELSFEEEIDRPSLTLLQAFSTTNEADTARLRLEAEGIPTFLDGERMGSNSFYSVATGGVKLLVPTALVADARVLLAQSSRLPDEIDDADELDELDSYPGTRRREIMRLVLIVILLGPFVVMLASSVISWLRG